MRPYTQRLVEFTCEQEEMEFTVGELEVPTFHLLNEKKFWYQLNNLLESKLQSEYLMKTTIQQTPLEDSWKSYSFMPLYNVSRKYEDELPETTQPFSLTNLYCNVIQIEKPMENLMFTIFIKL